MDRQKLYDQGILLLGQVETLSLELYDMQSAQRVDHEQSASRKASIGQMVNNEKDPETGKALYTNDIARKAEASAREHADPILREIGSKIAADNRAVAVKQYHLTRLNGEISLIKAALYGTEKGE